MTLIEVCEFIEKEKLKKLSDDLYEDENGTLISTRLIRTEVGYDLTLGNKIGVLKDEDILIDTKDFEWTRAFAVKKMDENGFVLRKGRPYLLHTAECIKVREGYVGLVNIKSTVARLFMIQPPTVIDSGFEGQVVLEIVPFVNVKVYPLMKFVHIVTVKIDEWRKYKGHYNKQLGIVGARKESLW